MIARELLIRLGFDIDESKLNKFSRLVDDAKSKMTSLRENVAGRLGTSIKVSKNKFAPIEEYHKSKITNNENKSNKPSSIIDTKFAQIKAYRDELLSFSKQEKNEILELNKLEKAAINETRREERQKHLEKQRQLREEQKQTSKAQAGYRFSSLKNSIMTTSRRIALMSAAVGGMFALNTRGTLNDVEDYKKTGTTKSGNVFSKNQVKPVDLFSRSLKSVNYSIKEIRNGVVIDLLPPLNEILIVFKNWMDKNRELIKSKLKDTITAIGDALKIVLPILKRVFKIFDTIISPTLGWKRAITLIIGIGLAAWLTGVVLRVWNLIGVFSILAKHPLNLKLTAIIAVLALLIDEIYVTIEGGDSLINRFLKSDAWDFCIKKLTTIWGLLQKVGKAVLPKQETIREVMDETGKQLWEINKEKLTKKAKENNQNIKFIDMKNYKLNKPAPYQPKFDKVKDFGDSFANSPSIMNATNQNHKVINQKNSFNINVSVPVGTSEEQALLITNIVKKQIEKSLEYENEKSMVAIGAY